MKNNRKGFLFFIALTEFLFFTVLFSLIFQAILVAFDNGLVMCGVCTMFFAVMFMLVFGAYFWLFRFSVWRRWRFV
ncbi:hypothetical protein AAEL02_003251 [Salmonella enterica]